MNRVLMAVMAILGIAALIGAIAGAYHQIIVALICGVFVAALRAENVKIREEI